MLISVSGLQALVLTEGLYRFYAHEFDKRDLIYVRFVNRFLYSHAILSIVNLFMLVSAFPLIFMSLLLLA